MISFEIRSCKNGFVIFDGGFDYAHRGETRDPYVFETLDKALAFLKEKLGMINTGSEPESK